MKPNKEETISKIVTSKDFIDNLMKTIGWTTISASMWSVTLVSLKNNIAAGIIFFIFTCFVIGLTVSYVIQTICEPLSEHFYKYFNKKNIIKNSKNTIHNNIIEFLNKFTLSIIVLFYIYYGMSVQDLVSSKILQKDKGYCLSIIGDEKSHLELCEKYEESK